MQQRRHLRQDGAEAVSALPAAVAGLVVDGGEGVAWAWPAALSMQWELCTRT